MVDYWLGRCYHADLKGKLPAMIQIFKERLAASQPLKREAQQKLIRVLATNSGGTKCHISKKYAEFLQQALS